MLGLHKKDVAAAVVASAGFALVAMLAVEVAGRFASAGIAGGLVLVFLLAAALLYRQIEHKTEDVRVVSEASAALYQAIQPAIPLPPMSGFAIAADSALLLHTLLTRERPKTVVETGSGVSTLIIGYALKAQGRGRLISLEADPRHAQRTRDLVSLHGLGEFVTVIDAPLADLTVEGERYRWHDTRALDGVISIDLVFDDGPPLYLGKGIRRAGLPALRGKLGNGGVYLLNFVAAEERRAVADWLRRYPDFEAETLRTRKRNVILRRRQHPS